MKTNVAIQLIREGDSLVINKLRMLCHTELNTRLEQEFNVALCEKEIIQITDDFQRTILLTDAISIQGDFVDFVYRQVKPLIEFNRDHFDSVWYETLQNFLQQAKN